MKGYSRISRADRRDRSSGSPGHRRLKQALLWLVLAAMLAMLAVGGAAPAMAAEEGGIIPLSVEPSGDGDPPPAGGEEEPVDPPSTEEPPITDEPPVTDPADPTDTPPEPTQDPGIQDPTQEPIDPTEDPNGGDATAEPTDDPGVEDPTPEPTEEPVDPDPGNTGGWTNGGSSSPTSPPRGTIGGGTNIQQPSFAPSIRATPAPSGTDSPNASTAPNEPRYMTFAKLTQKSNSMSVVLFYSGAACVGVGFLGLLVLVIFIVRGRRADERDGIFEEIQHAEIRQPARPRPQQRAAQQNPQPQRAAGQQGSGQIPAQRDQREKECARYEQEDQYAQYANGYEQRQPVVHRPEPEALAVPVNGNMYTEEFEIPKIPQEPRPASQPERQQAERPAGQPARQVMRPAERPPIPHGENPAAIAEEHSMGMSRPPQPQVEQPSGRDTSYDTTEILREILYGEEQDR